MAVSRDTGWSAGKGGGSSFRSQRTQGALGVWVVAAMVTSVGLHLVLWKFARDLGLPDYGGMASAPEASEQRLPVDLRRVRLSEESVVMPAEPSLTEAAVAEREMPAPTAEPVDLTQFKELSFKELTLTTQVEWPTNIVTSPSSAAGEVAASLASELAAVPLAAAGDALSSQLREATGSLPVDPRLSEEQAVLVADEVLSDGDALGQSIAAATRAGAGGSGGEDGLASLDDLLSYSGPMTEDRTAMMPTDLLFEYNSAELKDTARLSLMKLGFIIQKNPEADISIEGHSDTFGGEVYNQTLSEARAEAVKNWLVDSLRLEAMRLNTRGWGKSKVLIPGGDVEAQAKNRRVEIVIRPKKVAGAEAEEEGG